MEGKLNPLKQLDDVLEFLNTVGSVFEHIKKIPSNIFELENDGINSPTFESIRDGLKEKITETNLRKVLKKLHDDTYITINNDQYSITWEGRLFILHDGGYEIRHVASKKVERELMELQKNNSEMAKRVYFLTVLLALCGVVASLYYLIEMAKGFFYFLSKISAY
jgi:hypothetical protein